MYLVTTYVDRLPRHLPIIMVDGTVPGWTAQPGDLHYDHHRLGGADIQIDEIPHDVYAIAENTCFVTTMTDADACCAAAWIQLSPEEFTPDLIEKLRAIAWDCDHLSVPPELSNYATFAAKAVATLKKTGQAIAHELQLPAQRQTWNDLERERYASLAFERGTQWILAAARGDRPFPGETGEADDYWQEIEQDAQRLLQDNRIQLFSTPAGAIALCNIQGIGRSVDPRAFYHALKAIAPLESLRPETITQHSHRLGGIQYTLGSIPLHPRQQAIDYTAGVFARLTQAEQQRNPDTQGWGGRRTVGGSAWNTSSHLEPQDIVQILCEFNWTEASSAITQ